MQSNKKIFLLNLAPPHVYKLVAEAEAEEIRQLTAESPKLDFQTLMAKMLLGAIYYDFDRFSVETWNESRHVFLRTAPNLKGGIVNFFRHVVDEFYPNAQEAEDFTAGLYWDLWLMLHSNSRFLRSTTRFNCPLMHLITSGLISDVSIKTQIAFDYLLVLRQSAKNPRASYLLEEALFWDLDLGNQYLAFDRMESSLHIFEDTYAARLYNSIGRPQPSEALSSSSDAPIFITHDIEI